MIARTWHTRVDPDRIHEYETFAQNISLPMFKQQTGFEGVLFLGAGEEQVVLSLWADRQAVEALAESKTYRHTVDQIVAADFLVGESTVEVFDVTGGFVADLAL